LGTLEQRAANPLPLENEQRLNLKLQCRIHQHQAALGQKAFTASIGSDVGVVVGAFVVFVG